MDKVLKVRLQVTQLQLQLEIATLPSYINSVDLDPFGRLSVFLTECRAQLPAPIKVRSRRSPQRTL
jgi:hypothetical protein